ncbi:MAG: crossover junction endodeoxyribonuclease RuvC [Anaerolineae bacterium SM23_84]|nr:MAG: crossover junction endodeoxyribonuclease RuvC [Anaerolineae bacterium SM23_84]
MSKTQPRDAVLVLGIDPGTATTGYGIVRFDGDALQAVTYGVITTASTLPLPRRLQQLYTELLDLIHTHQPTDACVEQLFFARNVRSALSVGHARGVILLALADAGLDTHEYTPLQVKKAIVGYGRAGKEQMQQMVRLLLSLESLPQPDDAADALAVAICHAHSYSTRAQLASAAQHQGE